MGIIKLTENQIYYRLKKLRDSNDVRVRIEARRELIESDRNILIEHLEKIIKEETDIEILAYTAELIVESNDKNRADRILPLIGSVEPMLRRHVCGLLGNCGDEVAIDALIENLQSDTSADVRVVAAWALGKIGHKKSLLALISARDYDFSEDFEGMTVSKEAIWAINEIEQHTYKPSSA